MKIPSIRKIEKQAEKYAKENFRPDPSLEEKMKLLESELKPICEEWDRIRDNFCNGSPCICKTHPRYYDYLNKIKPIQEEISKIARNINFSRHHFKKEKEKQLMLARNAKLKYLGEV